MTTRGMHISAVDSGDDRVSRVLVEGAGDPVELTLQSTHALTGDLTPWVPLVLPAAMHLGVTLHLHGPVDVGVLRGQQPAQTMLADWFPQVVRPVAVQADEVTPAADRSAGIGLLFSGGVDAFHSAMLHRDRSTHLLFVHGFDIPLWRTELRRTVSRHLGEVAAELDLELIEATTDVKPWMDQFVRWGEIYHGAATAGVALAHGRLIGEALIASSEAMEDITPWGSHPDLDPLWSSTGVAIVHDAIEYDRAAKVDDISSWDVAMRHLRVCWENPDEVYNCGDCEKCVRTMVNLHIAGALNRCETLPNRLDLARLRRPALNEEERLSIHHNLRALRARDVLDLEVERALRTALRRGSVLLPLDRLLVRPVRRHLAPRARRAGAAVASAARVMTGGAGALSANERGTGRIGVVTIVDNDNFGNRLQNFALQECLTSRGWSVETIPNTPAPMRRSLLVARGVAAIRKDGPVTFLRRNAAVLRHRLRSRRDPTDALRLPDPLRREAIARFTSAHIRELATDFASLADPAELADRYDHVVVGSDQVWNPGFRQANAIDFLTFARPEQRVAYAASFGVPEVPSFLRTPYERWLTAIPHISVREHRGAQIVHELTGRTVPVVADPTLVLDPRVWHEHAEIPAVLQGRRYLATFFLGGSTPSEETALAEYARTEDLEVVDLLHPTQPELRAMSPLQFIGAIRDAEVLATDSFHASVFSIVFERPSITRSRHTDDTRLTTLFDHAGIAREQNRVDGMSHTSAPDWPAARARFASLREESWRFLDTAIGRPLAAEGTP